MTVTYSFHVSKARLSAFPQLLLRWKGSIYKLLYREVFIFMCLYYALFALYRVVLNEYGRGVFERISLYCKEFTDLIPITFVLGFYVTIVVGRWWQQYLAIPWPDKCCMLISTYVNGADEKGRMIRRTLARYLNLMAALTFQAISTSVKKRFPTIDHLIEAGLMTKLERKMYDDIIMPHGKWWVPAQWFGTIATNARREGRIKDEILLKHLLKEMHVFRGNCGLLFSYDWISIPLVYTQVVTLAVYTYFMATLMGRQYLFSKNEQPNYELNSYVPVFLFMQFFFYMGWLKVAEQLINPFGEDDDDFEMNWCVDRNLQLSYNVVDVLHDSSPPLVKDQLWDESEPMLPYTKSSFNTRSQPHLGSAMNLNINQDDSEFMPMETIPEVDKENSCSTPSRTTSFDHVQYNCSILDSPTLKASSATIDTDSASVSSLRFANFSGSRLVNMILGSNRELSHSTDSVKDGHSMSFTGPFALRPPFPRRNSSIEPSPLAIFDDTAAIPEQPLLPPFQEEKISESSVLLNIDESVYQDKPLEFCTVKIPDLPAVEEISIIGRSRDETPVIYPVNITLPLDDSSNSDEADTSSESLSSSSDRQSTNSFSGLLENQV